MNQRERQQFRLENSLVLPYHSNFDNLRSLFKRMFQNIFIIFKNTNLVKSMLIKNSPDTDVGCNYRIPCDDFNKIYIGQTGKSLQARIKQHKYSIRSAQESSAGFLHVRDSSHSINFNNATIYKRIGDYQNRKIVESSNIQYYQNKCFNTSLGIYTLDSYIVRRICDPL